jgi:hypothetical protein
MDWKKLVLAAFVFAVISQFVHMAGSISDMPYYTDPAYFSLWSPIMMPGPSPPGMEFYTLSILVALASGLIFAYAYLVSKQALALKKAFKSDRYWKVGLKFGVFLFLLTGFTGTLSMYLLFAVPSGLLFSWAVQSLAICLASGMAFAKIIG